MKLFKWCLLSLLLLTLAACASFNGTMQDKRYTAPNGAFSVQAPSDVWNQVDGPRKQEEVIYQPKEMAEGGVFVVNFSDDAYGGWPSSGFYSVEWDDVGAATSNDVFAADVRKKLSNIQAANSNLTFSNGSSHKERKILYKGRPAIQALYDKGVSYQGIPAVYVLTVINYNTHYASISSIQSVQGNDKFDWAKYNAFLNSFRVL